MENAVLVLCGTRAEADGVVASFRQSGIVLVAQHDPVLGLHHYAAPSMPSRTLAAERTSSLSSLEVASLESPPHACVKRSGSAGGAAAGATAPGGSTGTDPSSHVATGLSLSVSPRAPPNTPVSPDTMASSPSLLSRALSECSPAPRAGSSCRVSAPSELEREASSEATCSPSRYDGSVVTLVRSNSTPPSQYSKPASSAPHDAAPSRSHTFAVYVVCMPEPTATRFQSIRRRQPSASVSSPSHFTSSGFVGGSSSGGGSGTVLGNAISQIRPQLVVYVAARCCGVRGRDTLGDVVVPVNSFYSIVSQERGRRQQHLAMVGGPGDDATPGWVHVQSLHTVLREGIEGVVSRDDGEGAASSAHTPEHSDTVAHSRSLNIRKSGRSTSSSSSSSSCAYVPRESRLHWSRAVAQSALGDVVLQQYAVHHLHRRTMRGKELRSLLKRTLPAWCGEVTEKRWQRLVVTALLRTGVLCEDPSSTAGLTLSAARKHEIERIELAGFDYPPQEVAPRARLGSFCAIVHDAAKVLVASHGQGYVHTLVDRDVLRAGLRNSNPDSLDPLSPGLGDIKERSAACKSTIEHLHELVLWNETGGESELLVLAGISGFVDGHIQSEWAPVCSRVAGAWLSSFLLDHYTPDARTAVTSSPAGASEPEHLSAMARSTSRPERVFLTFSCDVRLVPTVLVCNNLAALLGLARREVHVISIRTAHNELEVSIPGEDAKLLLHMIQCNSSSIALLVHCSLVSVHTHGEFRAIGNTGGQQPAVQKMNKQPLNHMSVSPYVRRILFPLHPGLFCAFPVVSFLSTSHFSHHCSSLMDLQGVPIFDIVYGKRRNHYKFGFTRNRQLSGVTGASTSPTLALDMDLLAHTTAMHGAERAAQCGPDAKEGAHGSMRSSGDHPFPLVNAIQKTQTVSADEDDDGDLPMGGSGEMFPFLAAAQSTHSTAFWQGDSPSPVAPPAPRLSIMGDSASPDQQGVQMPPGTIYFNERGRHAALRQSGSYEGATDGLAPTHFAHVQGAPRMLLEPVGAAAMGASQTIGRGGLSRDWNSYFQELLEESENTEEERLAKYERLRQLAADFVHTAKKVAKTIISENFLPKSARTILSNSAVGGVAGGTKYVHHGILFKFARDTESLYGGSDANAMKAAGHELKGVMRFFPCEGVHVPLMALIDYRGFRMVAESVLPIDKQSLCYGSNDGGKNVINSNAQLAQHMKAAAKSLNLKEHVAGISRSTARKLWTPADVEAHIGRDGRFYVIDFARIFPPTAEDEAQARSTFLYRQFRPEFVRNYCKPLSSDAFSPMGQFGEQELNEREVREATDYLTKVTVPSFAHSLESLPLEVVRRELTELTHRAGINVRYLGLVRQATSCTDLKRVIFHEMCARVIKNGLWALMRKQARLLRIGCEEEVLRALIISFLNRVLGWSQSAPTQNAPHMLENATSEALAVRTDAPPLGGLSGSQPGVAEDWWRVTMRHRLQHHFCNALSDEELDPKFPLRGRVNMYDLFKRTQELTGISLTERAMEELRLNPESFRIVLPDIKKVTARVKHMNIVSLAEAKALSIQAMRAADDSGERLFHLAVEKFEMAFRATPDNTTILNDFAEMLRSYAMTLRRPVYELLSHAFELYCKAKNHRAICDLTDEVLKVVERRWDERQLLLMLAHRCFEYIVSEGVYASPVFLLRWGDVLMEQARMAHDDNRYKLAGAKFREAIEQGVVEFHMGQVDSLEDEELAVVFEAYRRKEEQGVAVDVNEMYSRSFLSFPVLIKMTTLTNIHTLVLEKCDHVFRTDETGLYLRRVLEPCATTLRHVSFADNATLTFDMLWKAFSVLHSLESLCLRGCIRALGDKSEELLKRGKPTDHCWWRGLVELDISETAVEDAFVEKLTTVCPRLRRVNLSHTFVSSLALSKVVNACKLLEEFVCNGCSGLDDDVLDDVVGLRHLKTLRVCGCSSLTVSGLQVLQRVPKLLETIDLSCCPLNRYVVDGIAAQPISSLFLRGCSALTDELVSLLMRSTALQLRELHLGYCQNVSAEALAGLISSQVDLTRVSVSGCQSVNGTVMDALCERRETLISLSLYGCYRIGTEPLSRLRVCTKLQRLTLSGVHREKSQCPFVAVDNIVLALAPALTRLVKLGLRRTNLSDIGLDSVLSHCKRLEDLDVGYSDVVLGRAKRPAVGECLTELRRFSVVGCRFIEFPPRQGCVRLGGLQTLVYLNVMSCRKLQKEFLEYLTAHPEVLPALEVLACGGTAKVKLEHTAPLARARPLLLIDYRAFSGKQDEPLFERKPWRRLKRF